MPLYDVLRRHEGDDLYDEGDTREISDVDAAHLVRLGVLRKAGADDKAVSEAEGGPAPVAPKPKGGKAKGGAK